VLDHRSVQIELAALGQQMRADRRGAFGRGCDLDDRVLVPGSVRLAIGETTPQVDDATAIHVNAAGGTTLARTCRGSTLGLEVAPNGVGDLTPAVLDMSLYGCYASPAYHGESPV